MKKSELCKVLILIFFINIGFCQTPVEKTSEPKSSIGYLTLQVTGTESTARQEDTGVTVKNSVEGVGSKLRFRYDIKTPKVDDFHFVLALDSSASLKNSPKSEQAKAVIDAVPKFINDSIKRYSNKNLNVSILSWDNRTNFAYSNFDNKNPKNAKLVKIQKAEEDIRNNLVFGPVNDAMYYYRCDDIDGTNLSEAISASIDVLDNNPPINYHRTQNFIIIVVGESEYTKCSDELISDAREKGYSIYAILMEPSEEKTAMMTDLERITGSRNRVLTCHAIDEELESELLMHLEEALKNATSEPVADDVKIFEPLYGYLNPEEYASIEILGLPGSYKEIKCESKNNSEITFRLPDGLQADNTTEVMFDANFALRGLPVSATKNSNPITFALANDNTLSNLSYTWLKKYPFVVNLPENTITIESTSSNSAPIQEKGMAVKDLSAKSASNEFGIVTLASLLTIFLILRRKI